jgi:GT2 family glycosyltransferase
MRSGEKTQVDSITLSVVVPAWNNVEHTRNFVGSVRSHTDIPYELIVVDNGSEREAAAYAERVADRAILNPDNLGFARGMNQGLAAARGEYVAFCNNDAIVPQDWASRLIETARSHARAAIVVPALTAATNPLTVRTEPGDAVTLVDPFAAPPAGVVYVMPRELMQRLGAWEEEYSVASGEDVDLCFKVWVNDLDIVFDERVLVQHVGHATAVKLDNWQERWTINRRHFLAKWTGSTEPPFLGTCNRERFDRNRATARAVATWMEQYFTIRDRHRAQQQNRLSRRGRRMGRAITRLWR